MAGDELFWELAAPLMADPAVQRSTMMGFPCLRRDGRFFAAADHRTGALLVKLPADRVDRLIDEGLGQSFAPAGRRFTEWVAVPTGDPARWRTLLTEALRYADDTGPGGFAGFPAAGPAFLAGLEKDNTKTYFDAHRATYQRSLLQPAKAFVEVVGGALRQQGAPRIQAEPRVGGSIFRIATDQRFGPATPYKTHLDFAFWEGTGGPRRAPALLLRLTSTELYLGVGVPAMRGDALAAYRTALRKPELVRELDAAVARLRGDGAELNEPTRKRPPPGIDPNSPAAPYAIRDALYLLRREPHPEALNDAGFAAWYLERLTPFLPVHQWLVRCTQPHPAADAQGVS
jgi:uncharacterized protein (TIGR02453 family)